MKRLAFAVLLVAPLGCASVATAPKTSPRLETTRRSELPTDRSVVVLSTSVLDDVLGSLPEHDTLSSQTAHLTAALERALFNAGWNPVPRPTLVRVVAGHRTAVALRTQLGRPGASLVDAAAVLSAEAPAASVLVVRGWRSGWIPAQSEATPDSLCTTFAEVEVELRGRTGELLWAGVGRGLGTDFGEIRAERRAGTTKVTDADLGCASRNGCGPCAPPELTPRASALLADEIAAALVMDLAAR